MMKRHTKSTLLLSIVILCVSLFVPRPSPIKSQAPLQFEQLHTVGYGTARVLQWSPDGETLAVGGSQGVWLYTNDLHDADFIEGHPTKIVNLAWSPDGSKIASVELAHWNKPSIWDVATDTRQIVSEAHTASITSLAWSPVELKLASSSEDHSIRIWEWNTSNQVWQSQELIGHTDIVSNLLWSPDGSKLASMSNDNTVRIWDSHTGEVLQVLAHHREISAIAWSTDSQKLVSGGRDAQVRIWDTSTGDLLQSYQHQDHVLSVAWNPANGSVASGSLTGEILLWDVNSSVLITQFPPIHSSVYQLFWNELGNRLVAVGSKIVVWDVALQDELYVLGERPGQFLKFTMTPRPQTSQFTSVSVDNIIRLWDTATGELKATLLKHNDDISSLAWHPDNIQVGGVSADGVIRTWDTDTQELLSYFRPPRHPDASIGAWSLDWTAFATPSDGLTIFDWQAISTTSPPTTPIITQLHGWYGFVADLAWSPDNEWLAVATILSDEGPHIFDTSTWTSVYTLGLPNLVNVEAVAWHPDYPATSHLAVGGAVGDGTSHVQIWDISATPALISTFQVDVMSISAIEWSPTGDSLAAFYLATDKVFIWNTTTQQLAEIQFPDESITDMDWGINQLLAISSSEQIYLWDGLTETLIPATWEASTLRDIRDIEWSPDGQRIAAADDDGRVSFWELKGE